MALQGRVPADYEERVYAGVLGKIIGVYLGRPFENWTNERIERELGEIWFYVHDKLGQQLIVADDDISGTFTFLRALNDHGVDPHLSAAAIGKTWLNYLIENRTVLWWGGLGRSTEHTAYLRLKDGIPAPESGSSLRNGRVVAEQIGSQIFIDGWAMVAPGDPHTAFELAGHAASVSHDGEAVIAAQAMAVMESLAFVEPRIGHLIRNAQAYLPIDSLIYRLYEDVCAWHHENPKDWRATFARIEAKYGYDDYGGGCHIVPNHAVILLALLYGDDDFQKSLMIANTAGWDTDCNSANVGCLMGIKNGLAGLSRSVDFRGPVADRMYLPTADGGRCITDAANEAYRIVNLGRALHGQRPSQPNAGARFHFHLPGATQGFQRDAALGSAGTVTLTNEPVPRTGENGEALDERALAIHFAGVGPGRVARVCTPTFLPPESLGTGGYGIECSPTLYSGQMLRARVVAEETNAHLAHVILFVNIYGDKDTIETIPVDMQSFAPGAVHHFHAAIPDTGGRPIVSVGLEVGGTAGSGTLYLDWLHWDGAPHVTLRRPDGNPGRAWRRAWVNAVSEFSEGDSGATFRLIQNGPADGFALTGCAEWNHYSVSTHLSPHLAERVGVVVCGRGLRRFVALVLSPDGMARLIERYDDTEVTLDETDVAWTLDERYAVTITARRDGHISATVRRAGEEQHKALSADIVPDRAHGNIGLCVANGHAQFGDVHVTPVDPHS